MNHREGIKRLVIVLGAIWILVWGFIVLQALLMIYLNSDNGERGTQTWDSDAFVRMLRGEHQLAFGVGFGFVLPAVVILIGRYIWRGFKTERR